MNLQDHRIEKVTKALNDKDVSELSQSDYDRLEDNFIATANEALQPEETLTKLRAAGFGEIADKLTALNDASEAYDWSRENL
jgi:hypothetical protein